MPIVLTLSLKKLVSFALKYSLLVGSKLPFPVIAFPTPYITPQDRANRCQQLFRHYNETGTASLEFVGKNTYHNPCKVECGLCVDTELPEENEEVNVIRSYPPHISLKDSIVKCTDEVEVYEQYMQDGQRCGPFHVS